MRQTAVEQFANRVSQLDLSPKDMNEFLKWFKEAKEIEKEQIKSAYIEGSWWRTFNYDVEKYYKETYE